jgi:hypothetical protein
MRLQPNPNRFKSISKQGTVELALGLRGEIFTENVAVFTKGLA